MDWTGFCSARDLLQMDVDQDSLCKVAESLSSDLSGPDWVNLASPVHVDMQTEQYDFTTQELEAGYWLCDEKCEDATSGFPSLPVSVAMAEVKSDGSEGFSEVDRKARCPSLANESSSISNLFAQLRALEVNESVINESMQNFGGGPQGIRAVVKALMFWMVERNRYLSQSSEGMKFICARDRLSIGLYQDSIFKVTESLSSDLTGPNWVNMSSSLQIDEQREQYELATQGLDAGSSLRDEQFVEGFSKVEPKARSFTLAKESSPVSNLFAQLRAVQVKESVMSEAIQKFGGGPQGIRAVVKAIMFWLVERNRCMSQSSDSSFIASFHDLLPVFNVVRTGQALSGSIQPAKDDQFGSFVSCNSGEGSCACSSRRDVGFKDLGVVVLEDFDELTNCEKDCETFSGVPDGMLSGPALHSSETLHRSLARNLSLSNDFDASGDTHPHFSGHKIRRVSHSSARNNSARESEDCSPVFSYDLSPPMREGSSMSSNFGEGDENLVLPHCPFSASRMDPQPQDVSSFLSFDMQSPILIDGDLSMASPIHGTPCGRVGELWSVGSMDMISVSGKKVAECVNSGLPLRKLADPKSTTTAASTRLARRERMNCKRRQSSGAADGSMVSRVMCRSSSSASSSVKEVPRPQGLPAIGDRGDLQYLFEKVLRPSDVGTLGRVILPKKDAESHLPWLAVREGIPFICEDYITRESMALRYLFWPNNKSRMYVLVNTGEFVRRHQLKELDRIFIYRNPQNGTYVVRARKARDGLVGSPDDGQAKEK